MLRPGERGPGTLADALDHPDRVEHRPAPVRIRNGVGHHHVGIQREHPRNAFGPDGRVLHQGPLAGVCRLRWFRRLLIRLNRRIQNATANWRVGQYRALRQLRSQSEGNQRADHQRRDYQVGHHDREQWPPGKRRNPHSDPAHNGQFYRQHQQGNHHVPRGQAALEHSEDKERGACRQEGERREHPAQNLPQRIWPGVSKVI
ncbi:hypothetical protein AHiyo1_22560 [Arthrobacter sp. Hiyo1]|nr:hypothetical protein AHiyo1_22560 [Arthrobacter sp. Hiyo1]